MTTTRENRTRGYDTPVVLVVEDEPAVARMYRRILEERYTVHVAHDGPSALDLLRHGVDVVLLDRMMPGMSGDEVLASIRECGFDCRVAMVTAVEPDLDIVAMGFDAYVRKPPTRERLFATVEDLLRRNRYTDGLQEYWAALAKRAALESTDDGVRRAPEYVALEADIEAMGRRLREESSALMDDMAFLSTIRRIDEHTERAA